MYEKEFFDQEMYAFGDTYYRTEITKVRLKPGVYHPVIENLKTVPELLGTPMTLTVTTDPKSSTIPE